MGTEKIKGQGQLAQELHSQQDSWVIAQFQGIHPFVIPTGFLQGAVLGHGLTSKESLCWP